MANYKGGVTSVCPFYIREAGLSITCEGIEGCSNVMMRFSGTKQKLSWQTSVCETFTYMRCPIAAIANKKYEEEV